MLVSGMARTQASVPPTAAMPSAQPASPPALRLPFTEPTTRSAGKVGLAEFHVWRNCSKEIGRAHV